MLNIKSMTIIGTIEERYANNDIHARMIWFNPKDQKPYEVINGEWVEITTPSPDIQTMIDHELSTQLVLAIRCSGIPNVIYIDSIQQVGEQVEMLLGEWLEAEFAGTEITLKVERMSKAEFAALEPFEL